jgi:hypothetical protein
MAIRPTDMQGSIWQATQTAPQVQRAEEAPRTAQAAAQAAFAAQAERRNESVAETKGADGNRVNADADGRGRAHDEPRERRPKRNGFDETADEAAGFEEPPHLIDFSA